MELKEKLKLFHNLVNYGSDDITKKINKIKLSIEEINFIKSKPNNDISWVVWRDINNNTVSEVTLKLANKLWKYVYCVLTNQEMDILFKSNSNGVKFILSLEKLKKELY